MYFCLGMTQENDIAVRARQDVLVIHPLKTFRLYSSTAQIQNLYCTVCICFSPFSLSSSLFQKQLLIRRQKDSVSVEPAGEGSTNSHGQLIKQRQLHKERERKPKDRNKVKKERQTDRHTDKELTSVLKLESGFFFVSQYPHVRRHKGDAQWLIERQRITIDSLRRFWAARIHPSILSLQ